MDIDWTLKSLSDLQHQKERKFEILTEICNQVKEAPAETRITTFLKSPVLFDCIDISSSEEETTTVCEILSVCISRLNLDDPVFTQLLERSLKHQNPNIRAMALNELKKIYQRNTTATCTDVELTLLIIACLDAVETEVAAPAIAILSQILITGYDNPLVQKSFLARLDKSILIRLRFYEVTVNLAKTSSPMLNKFEKILRKMLDELDNEDLLFQLNILGLLVSLAEQNHGLVYMEEKQILKTISKRIEEADEKPLDRLLIPGFMNFFGKIAYSQPRRIIENYPNMISCLFECLISQDISVLPTAFDTLANLAHSSDGKKLLNDNFPEKMKQAFQEFGNYIKNLPSELKNRAFNALEIIFQPENCGGLNNQIEEITEKWCKHLTGSNNLQMFLDICKNPFPEIKVACLSFIKTLCSYQWAILAIKNTAGFLEYLLNRRNEFDKDARFVKYEINNILSNSSIFDAHTIIMFKKFVNEGPHYVEGIVEVAVESIS